MDVSITVDQRKLNELKQLCRDVPKQLPRAIMRAVNDTATTVKTKMSKDIRATINIKAGDLKPLIKSGKASPTKLSTVVTLSASDRIPLKRFGARQTSKGVTYKISKVGKSRTRITDAFGPDMPRLGGHVFRRIGKRRFPIVKLLGPSPSVVFIQAGLELSTQIDAAATLNKNLDRRIDYILLKRAGAIK